MHKKTKGMASLKREREREKRNKNMISRKQSSELKSPNHLLFLELCILLLKE